MLLQHKLISCCSSLSGCGEQRPIVLTLQTFKAPLHMQIEAQWAIMCDPHNCVSCMAGDMIMGLCIRPHHT